ncbi:myb protein-related [Anaeramoeba flamelloides]|uniref:Myb protein-related n=1 Tax=Anaeramoeba flamelloides TaxID=1746091 RepID=A0AAV8A7E8_9EUKA|nr:myb protein-related [Anaeramoeba flamelloides]
MELYKKSKDHQNGDYNKKIEESLQKVQQKLKTFFQNNKPITWEKITNQFPHISPKDLLELIKNNTKEITIKGPWVELEDQLLCVAIEKCGAQKWSNISTFVPGRTSKQCRERWKNKIDPNICNDPLTENEKNKVNLLVQKKGRKWTEIANEIPGRSENKLKNYFYSQQRAKQREKNQNGKLSPRKSRKRSKINKTKNINLKKKKKEKRHSLGKQVNLTSKNHKKTKIGGNYQEKSGKGYIRGIRKKTVKTLKSKNENGIEQENEDWSDLNNNNQKNTKKIDTPGYLNQNNSNIINDTSNQTILKMLPNNKPSSEYQNQDITDIFELFSSDGLITKSNDSLKVLNDLRFEKNNDLHFVNSELFFDTGILSENMNGFSYDIDPNFGSPQTYNYEAIDDINLFYH